MSERLNEIGREEALFNALNVPCDSVKREVVGALYVVPLSDFSAEEIAEITKTLSNCKNIAAGETETILALIFHICTRFVQNEDQFEKNEGVRDFITKFGDKTVNYALDLLNRNMERKIIRSEEPEDDDQKFWLSMAIVNFLKSATVSERM